MGNHDLSSVEVLMTTASRVLTAASRIDVRPHEDSLCINNKVCPASRSLRHCSLAVPLIIALGSQLPIESRITGVIAIVSFHDTTPSHGCPESIQPVELLHVVRTGSMRSITTLAGKLAVQSQGSWKSPAPVHSLLPAHHVSSSGPPPHRHHQHVWYALNAVATAFL